MTGSVRPRDAGVLPRPAPTSVRRQRSSGSDDLTGTGLAAGCSSRGDAGEPRLRADPRRGDRESSTLAASSTSAHRVLDPCREPPPDSDPARVLSPEHLDFEGSELESWILRVRASPHAGRCEGATGPRPAHAARAGVSRGARARTPGPLAPGAGAGGGRVRSESPPGSSLFRGVPSRSTSRPPRAPRRPVAGGTSLARSRWRRSSRRRSRGREAQDGRMSPEGWRGDGQPGRSAAAVAAGWPSVSSASRCRASPLVSRPPRRNPFP